MPIQKLYAKYAKALAKKRKGGKLSKEDRIAASKQAYAVEMSIEGKSKPKGK